MPHYDKLPTGWQTELEKVTGASPIIEVIFDPDGRNITLNEKYDLVSMTSIRMERELDLRFASVPTFMDIKLTFNDPDNYFDSKKSNSPFHQEAGVLYGDHSASSGNILINPVENIEFAIGETLYLEGINPTNSGSRTNSETVTVKSFTLGSTYHTIELTATTTYPYKSDTFIRTRRIENIPIDLRVTFGNETNYVKVLTGRMLKVPTLKSGQAILTVVDESKINLDKILNGADSDSDNKLKCFNSSGSLVDSVNVVTGSVTFDRSKVGILDNCALGQWSIVFADENAYDLTSPNGTTIRRDKRYGRVGYVTHSDLLYPYNIHIDGDYAYLISATSYKLCIIDISTKSSPSKTGTLSLDPVNMGRFVNVSGNYAFCTRSFIMGNAGNSLTSIDISTKSSPSISDAITQSDIGTNFTPQGNLAINGTDCYVCADEGLFIFDITDPTSMSYTTTLATNLLNAYNIVIDGNYAYIACGGFTNPGLTIVDISTPASPSHIAHLSNTGIPYGIIKSGDYVYMTLAGTNALEIIDVSTVSSPSLTGSISGSGESNCLNFPWSVVVNGNYAFVTGSSDNSLAIIDITTKSAPILFEQMNGIGEPFYLDSASGLDQTGEYYCIGSADGFVIYRLDPSTLRHKADGINIQINADAFGGTSAANDVITFITGISYSSKNVVQSLYELETTNLSRDNNLINCSSYFGNKEIGIIYEAVSSSDETIKVACLVPTLIKASEELTITEGATTEDVTVSTGNDENTQYPPYIELDISALSNSYTTAATVTWKQRINLDTDFTFDNEYSYCDTNDYEINLTLDRSMTYNQAIELLMLHAHGSFAYIDNWGVLKIYNPYRDYEISSYDQISKDTNLKLPEPSINSIEMVNEIIIQGGYDSINQEFTLVSKFPKTDEENQSYIMNGFKRNRTIQLPGYFSQNILDEIAEIFYNRWKLGLRTVNYNVTLQGIINTLGDSFNIVCNEPLLDINIAVIGIRDITLAPSFNFGFTGLLING